MTDVRRQRFTYPLCAALLCVALAIGHWVTQRPGHDFDGDFALYVMQARTIVEGRPGTVEFIPNPANPINPALYPPMLPLLLAPVYSISGLDIEALKIVPLLSLSGWLFAIALIARRFVGNRMGLVATALLGAHPALWDMSNSIYSEFTFAMFAYAALLLAEWQMRDAGVGRRPILTAGFLAALLMAATLTRTAGIVLFPAVYLAALWRTRRIFNAAVPPVAIALLGVAAVNAWMPQDNGTYVHYLEGMSLWSLRVAVQDYLTAVAYLCWPAHTGTAVSIVVLALALPLMAWGLWTRMRSRMTVFELFTAGYLALLLLFPVHWEAVRYLVPLWPLLLLYLFKGAESVGQLLRGRAQLLIPAGVAASVAAGAALALSTRSLEPVHPSVTNPATLELFDEIEDRVPRDAIVLARKPTIVGLFTRRRASIWNRTFEPVEFWAHTKLVGADYLIQDRFQYGDGPFDPEDPLDRLVRDEPHHMELLFENDWYRLFRLRPAT